jgi:Predicted metal-dependent membrane protease
LIEEKIKEGLKLKKPIIKNREIYFDIILFISIIILSLIPVSNPYDGNLNHSSSQIEPILKPISGSIRGESGFSKLVLLSDEYMGPLQKAEQYVDLSYTFGGIGAAVLILLMYLYMTSKEQELIENPTKEHYPSKIWRIVGLEEIKQDKFETIRARMLILIPAAFIALAELLIFAGRTKYAVLIHIGVLIAFSVSNMFVKDLKVYRVYQALMLLPILRLVNLSTPIFFTTTLYTFVFVYAPILISIVIIIMDQPDVLTKSCITTKSVVSCIIPSIYMGFLFGIREYMTMRPSYLIPDLSLGSLLKLTLIMVFFVGLTEELIFRSLLQARLEEVLGIRETVILIGLLFGFMHSGYGNFYEILYSCLVGILLGYSFYKTKSLPLVVMAHGFANVFLFGVFPHIMNNWFWV